jgi:LacI family transcriptional regulator
MASSVQRSVSRSIKAPSGKTIASIHQKSIRRSVVAHPFLIKEIALQAGLSEATVDRVLNRRGGVRKHTAQRVKQAIRELDGQIEQAGLTGRKFLIDVVMQAPDRFSEAVRAALEEEMPALRPAVFRARYHFGEVARIADLAALIDRIAARGAHGLFLKAPDQPEIAAAVDRAVARGVPVVTLVTDVANCRRAAYVGMDNRAAGETAAYLIGEWLGDAKAKVLATLSSNSFRGEEEREIGFRRALRTRYPNLGIVEVSEGLGIDQATGAMARRALAADLDIVAAYSIGGGNRAVVEAFQAMARPCQVFVGHDLDTDNLALLREKRISAVLHHDLNADMRSACRIVMQAHRLLPQGAPPPPSQVQVITPFNLPAARSRKTSAV